MDDYDYRWLCWKLELMVYYNCNCELIMITIWISSWSQLGRQAASGSQKLVHRWRPGCTVARGAPLFLPCLLALALCSCIVM